MNESRGESQVVAGWYPDPAGRFDLRYHNGGVWTADVSTNGMRYVDPMGTAPSPASTASTSAGGGRNGPAVASMVLGIVSIAIGWLPFIVAAGIVAAVLAVVLGVVGRRRARRSGTGAGYALTGVITGLVGVLVCIGGIVFTVAFLREFDRYDNPEPHAVEIERCEQDGSTATVIGNITNLGDDTADYSIQVEFVRPGTDNAERRARADVDGLAPGETAPFFVSRSVSLDEVDCRIGRVDGPLPFGVEVEN